MRHPPTAEERYRPILTEAADLVAEQHKNSATNASVEDFDDLKHILRLTTESDLGGIPLYRPGGVEGDVLPLYDMTHTGNLKEFEGFSDIDLPDRIFAPLDGIEATKMR